jgi:imidazolonepropionase-like amidohydrolase
MSHHRHRCGFWAASPIAAEPAGAIAGLAAMLAALLATGVASAAGSGTVAVRGATVYTMAGPPLQDAVVLVRDGKIAALGPAAQVALDADVRVLRAAVVLPGLIDAHATAGLSGQYNTPQDQDVLEPGDPVQPELRALDAFNIQERLVEWVRGLGVTTVHAVLGPGAVVAGQSVVVKTWGTTVDAAVLRPTAMLAATLGDGATAQEKGKSPGTRSKAIALLRAELVKAREYATKRAAKDESKRPAQDLGLDVLVQVLRKEMPLLVTVHRHNDIIAALRLGREFDLALVLDGAAEAPQVLEEIRAAGVQVIVHPTMQRSGNEGSVTENLAFDTAARLKAAGVPFALQSGYEAYVPKTRVVLLEAGVAAANGLPRDAALAAITIDAARLIGVADRVGSLEVGKDGDLALYDGDPLETVTHCVGVIVDGNVVSEQAH